MDAGNCSLTGRMGYTDYSDASLTIALDINKRQWAADLLKEQIGRASCRERV